MITKEFRIWDKKARGFHFCDVGYQGHFILNLKGEFFNLQNGSGSDENVVSQWIGLKDMHGTKIFEGDIVHGLKKTGCFKQAEVEGVVEWNQKRCCFHLKGISSYKFGTAMLNSIFQKQVVGNIFETGEKS